MNSPPPLDKRTLVDRVLDRVRNNPVAAAIIILGICLTALASLTDSLRKLSTVLPSFGSQPELRGQWRSDPIDLYGAGPQTMTITVTDVVGDRVVGFVRFLDSQGQPASGELSLLQGRQDGEKLAFSFDGGVRRYPASGGPSQSVPESVSGQISANDIRLVYERDGHGAVAFVARKAAGAVSGRVL